MPSAGQYISGIGRSQGTSVIDNPYPHTEMLHVIERYRRPDLGHLELEMRVEDPGTFKKPWTVKRVFILDSKEEIMENICNENNTYEQHLVGK